MNPGTLRNRLELQQSDPIEDSGGGYEPNYSTIAIVRANRKAASSAAVFRAQQAQYEISHTIQLRKRHITKGMRFKEGERIYEIQHIRPSDDRETMLTVECLEVVEDAGL
jgi:SPP1 family predicted phage head-tail adaptor